MGALEKRPVGQSQRPQARVAQSAHGPARRLAEVIQINEGGAARRITKQRALLKSLAARGIQGDARAANLILNLMIRILEPDAGPAGPSDISAEDKAILEAYLAHHLKAKDDTK